MKIHVRHVLSLITAAIGVAWLPSSLHATAYTAAATGNWGTTSSWSPAGTPGAADSVEIPSGITITIATHAVSCGDLTVDVGGTLATTINGTSITNWGNITNNGVYSFGASGQSLVNYYAGAANFIAGSGVVSNQTANFLSGSSYTIVPGTVFLTGGNNVGSSHLLGAGTLINQGSIWYRTTTAPTITGLDCSAVGSAFVWTNVNTTLTPETAAYYNLTVGNTGSSGANLNAVGLSIGGNFTIVGTGPVSSWPVDDVIGGALNYFSTSGTLAANFPAAFSIGGLSQTSGKLTLPAGAVLTVTGSGAGTWSLTGGTLTQNATSTVKFTGGAPNISGTLPSAFANLIIDSTATNASASESFTVASNFTVNAGGSLDVTALGGSTYTLGTEPFFNSGAIKGSLATVAGSKVYAGGNGTYGTSTVSGDFNLGAGGTVNLDVNTTAAAANDHMAVGGALTLNSTTFNLNAPSAGATIDTADYVLVTASSISGTPVLNWVTAPANVGNYSLVTTGTTITLHNSGGVTPPPSSPTLTNSVSAGVLTLSWDTTGFPGFLVQSQTNSAGPVKGNWSDASAMNASPFTITLDPTQPPVYFRLSNTP